MIMSVDQTLEVNLIFNKAKNEIARIRENLFVTIGGILTSNPNIKILSIDNEKILFDVFNIDGFDHVEFKITQTGWGKKIR